VAQVIESTAGCHVCRREPADMAQKLAMALARGQRTHGRSAIPHLALNATLENLLRIYSEMWS